MVSFFQRSPESSTLPCGRQESSGKLVVHGKSSQYTYDGPCESVPLVIFDDLATPYVKISKSPRN